VQMLFKLKCDRKRTLHENCDAMHEECIQLAPEDLPELIEIVRAGLAVKARRVGAPAKPRRKP
jgi:hypothetical protein